MKNISDFLIISNSFCAVFEKRIAEVGINPLLYGATAVDGAGNITPPQAVGTAAAANPNTPAIIGFIFV